MPSLVVLLAAVSVVVTPGRVAHRETATELPPEMRDHYLDYNFVNAFSTVDERRLVADSRLDPSNPRLERVILAMRRLAARVDHVDPGMVVPRRPLTDTTDRADLLRVRSFDLDESRGEAWVYLEALALDPPANITLVSRFADLSSEDGPESVERLVAAAGRPLVVTFEIHHWVRVSGTWRREAAIRRLIGLGPI